MMHFDYNSVAETKLTGPDGAAFSTRMGLKHGYLCAKYIAVAKVPGVVVECGVANGSQVGMMSRALNDANDPRRFHLFDSFEGIPMAGPKDTEQPGIGRIQHDVNAPLTERLRTSGVSACSADQVKTNLRKWGCFGEFSYHRGWFQDTVPHFHSTLPIALLRLDGDLYESTMVCLEHLYPLVAPGGLVVIDDYALAGCATAVNEYLFDHQPNVRIHVEDVGGGAQIATWIK
jgi:O-methyltransferase